METGPLAGVGFALMAGKVTPWRRKERGILPFSFPGVFVVMETRVVENDFGLLNPRGWDINSAADPTWAKCLEFGYRVTSRARLHCLRLID